MRQPAAPLSFGSTSPPASAKRWKIGLLALAAIVAALNLWALSNWQRVLVPGVRGTLLAGIDPAVEAGGWQRITKLAPGSPLQASGVAVGDAVRFQYRGEAWLRRFGTDERINVEWRSAAGVRPLVVQPVADPGFERARVIPGYVSTWLTRLFTLLIGVLLALRRSDSPAVRALAMSLILNSLGGYSLPAGKLREQGVVWLNPFLEDIAGMGALWFAFQVQEDRPIWKKRSAMAIILCLFTMITFGLPRWALQWNLGYDAALWSAVPGLNWLTGFRGYSMAWVVVDVVTAAALWWSWRRASGAMRVRIAWIAVGLSAPLFADALNSVVLQILSTEYSYPPIWTGLVFSYAALGGASILGWAVLRHRVFDFGLVVQRALAYSIVSTMVVAAVGIAKWLTELLLHSTTHEHGTLQDAAVIVVVVLAFATLQQRVTKYVTRVFFSSWHRAAQELRDFVDQAARMTDGAAMKQQFVAAVDRFTEGSGCAVYTAGADDALLLEQASLPDAPSSFASSDEVVVKLGQGAPRVDLSRLKTRPPGDWIFPMMIRGRLGGALLIGARTEGVSYRPEELAQLADSARSIGLTLESLRAADLQRKHDEIARQLDMLIDANRSLAAENANLRQAPT